MTGVEEWRPIVGWEGWYEVSSLGRIKRLKGFPGVTWPGRILMPINLSFGYHGINLCKPGIMRTKRIHALVARAFLGPMPEGMVTNHKDGNKKNNAPSNLEYVTQLENTAHAMRLGLTQRKGSKNAAAKLHENDVVQIRALAKSGIEQRSIAIKFGVTDTAISYIVKRKTWRHVS